MKARAADIGSTIRVSQNLLAQVFEFSAAHAFQPLAFGPQGGLFIKVNRDVVARPNLCAGMSCKLDAIFHGHALNRHKRQNIGGADARMPAAVVAQVDQFRGLAHAAQRRFGDRLRLPGQSDDAAIVVGVAMHVEHPGAFDSAHRGDQRFDLLVIAPLGKIGNAFDQAPHAWFGFPCACCAREPCGNLHRVHKGTEGTEMLE